MLIERADHRESHGNPRGHYRPHAPWGESVVELDDSHRLALHTESFDAIGALANIHPDLATLWESSRMVQRRVVCR